MNIVKDDLIVKVDELAGEIEILREELNAVSQSREKLRNKVTDLEEELKKTKEQVKQQSEFDRRCEIYEGISMDFFNFQQIQIKRMKVMCQWLNVSDSLVLKWLVC